MNVVRFTRFMSSIIVVISTANFTLGQCELHQVEGSDSQGGDHFGSVAMEGDVLVVGAQWDNVARGSAYVFRREGLIWVEEQKLTASDGHSGDNFGEDVAMSGDRIAIAADSGVYVYAFDGGSWHEEAKLVGSDNPDDSFGDAVDMDGERIVIGAPYTGNAEGGVYVFRLYVGGWFEEAKLDNSDLTGNHIFGSGVAIRGGRLAVGALGNDAGPVVNVGAVYVYEWDGIQWVEGPKLMALPADRQSLDWVGWSVAMSEDGTRIVSGAPGDDEVASEAGAVYVFVETDGSWSLQSKLVADDLQTFDNLGHCIDISGETIVVGAPYEGNQSQGAAYVFGPEGNTWVERFKLEASNESYSDEFGSSVAIFQSLAAIGSPLHPDEFGPGAAYVYGVSGDCNDNTIPDACDIFDSTSSDSNDNLVPDECEGDPCEGDANGDNIVDPLDSGFVLSRFGCGVGSGDEECDAADQNGDGVVDPLDVGFVLSRFGSCE